MPGFRFKPLSERKENDDEGKKSELSMILVRVDDGVLLGRCLVAPQRECFSVKFPPRSSIPLLDVYSGKCLKTIVHKSQNGESSQVSINRRRINRIWYSWFMPAAVRMNQWVSCAKWKKPNKDWYCVISLICLTRVDRYTRAEVPRGLQGTVVHKWQLTT